MATKEEIIAQRTIATEHYILQTLPVLYAPLYRLDGSPFISADGHGHTCTVTGATWGGQGRTFDGIDDVINCGSDTELDDIFDGGGTAIVWFKANLDGEGDAGRILDKALGWRWHPTVEAGSNIRLTFTQGFDGGADGYWVTAVDISIAAWHFAAVTYNASSVDNNPVVYIDGTIRTVGSGLTEDSTPLGARVSDAAANLLVGNESGSNNTFDGTIGEALLYNRALTPLEVQNNLLAMAWRYR